MKMLKEDLFKGYSADVLPVRNQSSPMLVSLGFYLIMMQHLNMKSQIMTTNGYLKLTWVDELLQWNPAEYGGIDEMLVFQTEIWKPDIMLENTATHHREPGTVHTLMSVWYTGSVRWEPGVVAETSCIVDITKYPFDTQICDLSYLSWMRTNKSLKVVPEAPDVSLELLLPNGEWDITHAKLEGIRYPSTYRTGYVHTGVQFTFHMHRKRFFFILNTLIPVMLLSNLNVLVFILPSSCGERMGLAVTVLLAFTVYLSIISENIPQTSKDISIYTIYLTVLLSLSTASVVCAGIVLNIHFRDPDQPVPQCLISFFGRMYVNENIVQSEIREKPHELSKQPLVPPICPAHHQKTLHVIKFASETETGNETKMGMATPAADGNASNRATMVVPEQVPTQEKNTDADSATEGRPGNKRDNANASEHQTAPTLVSFSDAEEEEHGDHRRGSQGSYRGRQSSEELLLGSFARDIQQLVLDLKREKKYDVEISWHDIGTAMDRFCFWVFFFVTCSVNVAVIFLLEFY